MLQGCEGCFNNELEYKKIALAAKEYASKEKTTVAICKEPNSYQFYKAEVAQKEGYQIVEYISQYSGAST